MKINKQQNTVKLLLLCQFRLNFQLYFTFLLMFRQSFSVKFFLFFLRLTMFIKNSVDQMLVSWSLYNQVFFLSPIHIFLPPLLPVVAALKFMARLEGTERRLRSVRNGESGHVTWKVNIPSYRAAMPQHCFLPKFQGNLTKLLASMTLALLAEVEYIMLYVFQLIIVHYQDWILVFCFTSFVRGCLQHLWLSYKMKMKQLITSFPPYVI